MLKLKARPIAVRSLHALCALAAALTILIFTRFGFAQEALLSDSGDGAEILDGGAQTEPAPDIQSKIDAASDVSPTGDTESLILNSAAQSAGTPAQLHNVVFPLDNLGKGVGQFDSYDLKSGAYSFSIPIEVPPGTANLTPEVSISYSSEGTKDGLLGVGFTISAEDCIERRSPAVVDGSGNFVFTRGAPSFTAADAFFIAGQPLIKCDSQPGGPNTSCPAGTYRRQQNDFAKIEKLSTGFRISEKSGIVKEYGLMVNGASTTGNFDSASRYCLNRTFRGPNEIVQTWQMAGRPLPQAIYYGGTAPGEYRRSLIFEYEDRPAADMRSSYAMGGGQLGAVYNQKRLKSVSVNVLLPTPGYSQLRKYYIDYESSLSPASNRSRVSKIRECGQATDAVCETVAEFSYTQNGSAGWEGTDWTAGGIGSLNFASAFTDFDWNRGYADIPQQFSVGSYAADIDGNGTVDIFRRDNIASPLALLNPGSAVWSSNSGWAQRAAVLPELVHREGVYRYDNGVRVFDINGDGYQDVVQAADRFWGPNSAAAQVYIWDPNLNGGQGGYNPGLGAQYAAALGAAEIRFNLFTPNWGCTDFAALDPGTIPADVNGDGLTDIIVSRTGFTAAYGSAWRSRNEVWLNNGNGFSRGQSGYYDSFPAPLALNQECSMSGNNGVRLGDVNGDGLVDVIQLLNDLYQSPNAGVVYRRVWINNGNGWNAPQNITGLPSNLNGLFSILSSGTYSTNPAYSSRNTGAQLADVNGDGLDDLVQALCADAPASLGGTDCSVWNTFISTAAGAFKAQDSGWKLPTPAVFITTGTQSLAPVDVDMGVRLTDVDDDGLVDVIANRMEAGVDWALNKKNQYRFDRDRIALVKNRLGGTIRIQYAKLGKALNPKLAIPKVVVSSITTHNGRSGGAANAEASSSRTFSFFGGRLDKQSRSFAGFRAATVVEQSGSEPKAATTWFNNRASDFCRLFTESDTLTAASACIPGSVGCYISGAENDFAPIVNESLIQSAGIHERTTTDYASCGANNSGAFFQAPARTESYVYDPANPTLSISKREDFFYDAFGNQIAVYHYKDAADAQPYLADWAYYATPSSNSVWIYDRVAQGGRIAFASDRDHAIKAEYFYYDNLSSFGRVGASGLVTRRVRHGYDYELGVPSHRYTETMEYTPFGNLKKMTDARGVVHETDWNSFFPEIAPASESTRVEANSSRHVASYGYDQDLGLLLTKTLPNGVKEQYRYNTSNKLSTSWKESQDGAKAEERQYFYNNIGQPGNQQSISTRIMQGRADSPSRQETAYIDGLGQVYFKLNMARDYLGVSTLYDGAGRVLKTTLPYATVSFNLDRPFTANTYDLMGRKTSVTDPGGYRKNLSYRLWRSDSGEVLSVETESSSGAPGEWRKKHLAFDIDRKLMLLGECAELPCDVPSAGQAGVILTRFGYDYVGNQTDIFLPGPTNARVKRFFDGFGRLEAIKDPDLSNCPDASIDSKASGCPIRFEYDAGNNITKVEDAQYAVDPANGTAAVFTYDGLGRLTRKTLSKAGQTAVESYGFDLAACGEGAAAVGLPTLQSFANPVRGEATTRTLCYDQFGRLNKKRVRIQIPGSDSGEQETTYSYYPDGHLQTTTLPDGEVLTHGWDELDRASSLTSSAAGSIIDHVVYDSEGLKQDIYSAGGRYHTTFTYRNMSILPGPFSDRRLGNIRTVDGLNQGYIWEKTFDYDGLGNIKTISDYDFLTPDVEEFRYDHLNRLVNYDVDGSPVQKIWYDSTGNQSRSLTNPLPPPLLPQMGFTGSCSTVSVKTRNTAAARALLRPKSSRKGSRKSFRQKTAARRADLLREPAFCAPSARYPFGLAVQRYDLSQSTAELSQRYGEAYTGLGGPHSVRCVGGDAADPCANAAQTMQYDPNGNLVSLSSLLPGAQSESYEYTFENRLSRIARMGLAPSEYFYGPLGEKVASRENGLTTFFVDRNYIIEGGQPLRFYDLDGQTLAYRKGGGAPNFQVVDHLGSVRAIMDNAGNLIESRSYYPFGGVLSAAGAGGTARGFGGHTGYSSSVYDFGARFYHPALQRFLQPDNIPLKMGDANNLGSGDYRAEPSAIEPDLNSGQSTNRYAFVLNNPVHFIDPDGHAPRDAVILAGVRTAAPVDTVLDQRGHYRAYIGFSDNGGREIGLNDIRGTPHYKVGMSDGSYRFMPVTRMDELQRMADDRAGVTDQRETRAKIGGAVGEKAGMAGGGFVGGVLAGWAANGLLQISSSNPAVALGVALIAAGTWVGGKWGGEEGKSAGSSLGEASVPSAPIPLHWRPEPVDRSR